MKFSKNIKRCPNCDRVFGSSQSKTYCSDKCQNEYSSKHKTCIICKKEFKWSYVKQKYCSRQCRTEYLKIRESKRRLRFGREGGYLKTCRICNKEFKTKSNEIVCSKLCRDEINMKKVKLFNVFERDNFRCAYCGKTSYEDGVKLIVEHIFPRSKGGTNEGHNIITACSDCNARKNNKIMDWNVILTLWQIVDKRNRDKNIDWNCLKEIFDNEYKTLK